MLAAEADWVGLFGLWFHPVVEVTVTNSGTSSLPVTVTVDQRAKVRWSSQEVTCTKGPATTCTTKAEVAPGEKFKIVLEIYADPWPEKSPNRKQVHVSATLGVATDSENVTLWDCLWPTVPDPTTTPPSQQPPSTPATPSAPSTPPTTTPPPGSPPANPTKPTTPSTPVLPPVTTTTPPTNTTTPDPGRSEEPPPSTSTPPSGGLGGLLGWLLGG
jgi:hypothetical protein